MRIIKRVTIGSAFKVGAAVSGLIMLILGIPAVLCQGSFLALLSSAGRSSSNSVNPAALMGGGFVGIVVFWIISVVVAAIGGGVFGALYAILYNATVGITGGIEVEVQ
jgi:hypothetical protein